MRTHRRVSAKPTRTRVVGSLSFAQAISRETIQRKWRGDDPISGREGNSRNPRHHFRHNRYGRRTKKGRCRGVGHDRATISRDARHSRARTTRTPAAARDSIRANFEGAPIKETEEDEPGIWRKKSIIIRLTRSGARGDAPLRLPAEQERAGTPPVRHRRTDTS